MKIFLLNVPICCFFFFKEKLISMKKTHRSEIYTGVLISRFLIEFFKDHILRDIYSALHGVSIETFFSLPCPVLCQRGLTREFSSNFKPTFYWCCCSSATPTPRRCTQLQLARWRLHCILQKGGGVRGDKPIVYHFYALATRWTVHAKIYS